MEAWNGGTSGEWALRRCLGGNPAPGTRELLLVLWFPRDWPLNHPRDRGRRPHRLYPEVARGAGGFPGFPGSPGEWDIIGCFSPGSPHPPLPQARGPQPASGTSNPLHSIISSGPTVGVCGGRQSPGGRSCCCLEAVEEPSLRREPDNFRGRGEGEVGGPCPPTCPPPHTGGGFLLSKSSEGQSPPLLPHPTPLGKARVALVSPTFSTLSSGPQSPLSVRQGLDSEMRSAWSRALLRSVSLGRLGWGYMLWRVSTLSPRGAAAPQTGCPSPHLLTDSPGPWSCSVYIHSSGSLQTLTKCLSNGE